MYKCSWLARDVHVPVFFAGLGEAWLSLAETDKIPPGVCVWGGEDGQNTMNNDN